MIEERRPVPLEHHYLVGRELHPMHVEQDGTLLPNPYVVSLEQRELRTKTHTGAPAARCSTRAAAARARATAASTCPGARRSSRSSPSEGMLPAIYFVFSRAGCDRSVRVAARRRASG